MALKWNYTLGSGEILVLTAWSIDGTDIGVLTTAPSTVVYDNRFIISTSEVATVIVKTVSDIDDATFECKVQTSVDAWKYKMRVEITGERHYLKYDGVLFLLSIHYGYHPEIVRSQLVYAFIHKPVFMQPSVFNKASSLVSDTIKSFGATAGN